MIKITERKDRPGRRRVQLICKDPSRTEQSHREECDINTLLKKSMSGTTDSPVGLTYGDFASIPDYQECVNRVIAAREDFESLSSDIRNFFQNNPANLIGFMNSLDDPKNLEKAVELGLVADLSQAKLEDIRRLKENPPKETSEGSPETPQSGE